MTEIEKFLRIFERLPAIARLLGANLAVTAVTFLTSVILARGLGPDGRGVLASVTILATTIAPICLLGIHVQLSRIAGRTGADTRTIYRHAYVLGSLLSALGIVVYFVLAFGFIFGTDDIDWGLILLGAFIIPGSVASTIQVQVELGRRAYKTHNLSRLSFAMLNFVFAALLWMSGQSAVFYFVFAMALAVNLAALLSMLAIRISLGQNNTGHTTKFSLGKTLSDSREFALVVLFAALATQADKLLLAGLFPAVALGYFVVAAAVAQLQHTVGEAFAQFLFSKMTVYTKVSEIDLDWLGRRLRQTMFIYAGLCLVFLAVLPLLVPIVYGSAFNQSVVLLYVLLPAVAFRAMTRPFEELFRGLGYSRAMFWSLGTTTAVLVGGVFWAASLQSVQIAAWAVLAANLTGMAVAVLIARQKFALSIREAIIPGPADVQNLFKTSWSNVKGLRG